MPGAAERFARELCRLRTATPETVEVRCGSGAGVPHQVTITALDIVDPRDHDVDAERVVAAVGGEPPTCLRLAELAPRATAPQLWASIRASGVSDHDGTQAVLERLPARARCRLLAARLEDEFATASECVRDSVAKLGLSLLAPTYEPTAADVAKFQMTQTLPRWDTGPRWWTDKELVLLQRWLRVAPDERFGHLSHLPSDPLARRVVCEYAASLLEGHHLYTPSELATALSPVFHNVSRLIRMMLDERTLVESSACFRTQSAATQRAARR